jgi:DNA polymerase elongation subunit (family B)
MVVRLGCSGMRLRAGNDPLPHRVGGDGVGIGERVILVLDIETERHPLVPVADADDEGDRCPAAPHHRIVAAAGIVLEHCVDRIDGSNAYAYRATRAVTFGGEVEPDERRIVEHLARAFAKSPKLLTWNGDGFDLRVIIAAAMEHGIQIPWLFHRDVTYRYGTDGNEDLMDAMSQFGAARRGRQDPYARRCGLPGKMGVDGGDVDGLVKAKRYDELRAYNGQDVGQLAGIFLRREYVSGRLSRTGYQMSAQSLVSLFEKTPGLQPIVEHERFDRKKFLLEEV